MTHSRSPSVEIDITKVVTKAMELSSHSWEYGTAAESLLEFDSSLSVFSRDPFPGNKIPLIQVDGCRSLQYAKEHIQVDRETLCKDKNGVADPASLGVSAILLGQSEPSCREAAHRQMEYISKAPRYGNERALSHRTDVKEAWADFIYMVPPFLAYLAVAESETAHMKSAIHQCQAYRNVLANDSTGPDQGLWHHIVGPLNADPGYWSTSNGWVAAGLARVLATLKSWKLTRSWPAGSHIVSMIQDVLDGVIATDERRELETLLPNYLYSKDEEPWFDEVAGTALLASTVYRMAVLEPQIFEGTDSRTKFRYLDWAENKRQAVYKSVDPETGVARPAVNPLKHSQREPLMTGSPEGQSFVVLLWAAHRDYIESRNS
ncbi:hypothetical protein BDV96DRAFT_589451 [Lophiotrema nucula]|uniref:Six-hairpin glycosidase-like protein n=1 Tax=Lophiotrema nucula TaxID=690887 RepID=A0A6A5YM91_9PLEO|nr:hypothetical protein BDV96DRAFT_589451 [Lophiotrema nucula]